MTYNELASRFDVMSQHRDKVENSSTEAKCYETEEGYVQEVVSKSPARIRDENGELFQVVTRRRTVTAGPLNTPSSDGAGSQFASPTGEGDLGKYPTTSATAASIHNNNSSTFSAPPLNYGRAVGVSSHSPSSFNVARGPSSSSFVPARSVSNYGAVDLPLPPSNNTPSRNGGAYVSKYRLGEDALEGVGHVMAGGGVYGGGGSPSSTGGDYRFISSGVTPMEGVSPVPRNPTATTPSGSQHEQSSSSIAWVRNGNPAMTAVGNDNNNSYPTRPHRNPSPPNSALRGGGILGRSQSGFYDDENMTVVTESRASLPQSRSSSVTRTLSRGGGGGYSSEQYGHQPSSNYTSSSFVPPPPPRSVTITGVSGTTEIEPSRVSPIHVTTRYAPVKYVTRGELRRRQREHEAMTNRRGQGGGGTVGERIRYSSVPRLDSRLEDDRIGHGGYTSNQQQRNPAAPRSPPTTWGANRSSSSSSANRRPQHQQQHFDDYQQYQQQGGVLSPEEVAFRTQRPLPTGGAVVLSPGSIANGPPRYSSIPLDDDLESIASSAAGDNYRRQQQQQQYRNQHQHPQFAAGVRGSSLGWNGPSQEERNPFRASSRNGSERGGGRSSPLRRSGSSMQGYNSFGVHHDANFNFIEKGDGSVYSASPSYRAENRRSYGPATTTYDLPETGVEAFHVARFLAHVRSISMDVVPSASQYVEAAFKLLTRGTYLVKYGREGFPHERFFALRMVPDERQNNRTQPYLVWALHGDSAVFKERVHLGHLRGVTKGTASEGFTRSILSPDVIEGPHVGQKKCTLPTTFAFSLIFRSSHAKRSVDLLALDDQTFRCWHLVCSYFVAVNNLEEGGNGGGGEGAALESLVGDTPSRGGGGSVTN